MRNSFFFVRTCASSSLNAEIVICLSISLLYHTRRFLAPFSVRYCLRNCHFPLPPLLGTDAIILPYPTDNVQRKPELFLPAVFQGLPCHVAFELKLTHPEKKIAAAPIHNSPFPANTSTGANRASRASKEKRIMKATGIVRRVDDLGRIVIPKEIRRTLRIREGDPLQTSLTQWERFCFSMLDLAKRRGW